MEVGSVAVHVVVAALTSQIVVVKRLVGIDAVAAVDASVGAATAVVSIFTVAAVIAIVAVVPFGDVFIVAVAAGVADVASGSVGVVVAVGSGRKNVVIFSERKEESTLDVLLH